MNDFDIAERHGLDLLNIFDNQGKANDNCGIFKVVHYRIHIVAQ